MRKFHANIYKTALENGKIISIEILTLIFSFVQDFMLEQFWKIKVCHRNQALKVG